MANDISSTAAAVTTPTSVHEQPRTTWGLLANLPRKREAIRQMTPSWFTVSMGTGSVSITVATFPFAFSGQQEIAWAIWWLNVLLFTLFSLLFLGRVIAFSSTVPYLLTHSNQSLFLGAIPMAFSTITNGVVLLWAPRFGVGATQAAHVMFWVNLPAVFGCILLVPLLMFTTHSHGLHSMLAIWLLPVVPACVAANTAGVVASSLTSPHHAVTVIYMGICLLGIGFLLSYQICTIYYQRLICQSLPAREVIVSSFLPVGPMAMTAWALLNLSKAAFHFVDYYNQLAVPGVDVTWLQHEALPIGRLICSALAMFLWGFATWWLLVAFCCVGSTLNKGVPFNLGWWGAIFPMGVYAGATSQLGKTTQSHAFQVFGAIATCAHVLMWLTTTALTAKHGWTGDLFHAPCLSAKSAKADPVKGPAAATEQELQVARAVSELEEKLQRPGFSITGQRDDTLQVDANSVLA